MASPRLLLALVATIAIVLVTEVESRRVIPNRLCDNTEFPELCNSILKNERGDDKQALKANMRVTRLHTMKAWAEAKKLLPTASVRAKTCLEGADQQYSIAVEALVLAVKAMDEKDVGSLKSKLSSAMTAASSIDWLYDETPGEVNPFAKSNTLLKKLNLNSLSMSDQIKW